MRPIRFEISSERAIDIYNRMSKIKVSTEEELNDTLGNGRTSISVSSTLLSAIEINYLIDNGADINPILLVVRKETYPGIYLVGEC